MVFLGDWTPKAAAPSENSGAPSPDRPAGQRPQVAQPKPNPPAKLGLDSSGFTIKSVEVVDGVIVLQVANRTKSAGNYRIELGINFDQLGFSVANVHPIDEFRQAYCPGGGETGFGQRLLFPALESVLGKRQSSI